MGLRSRETPDEPAPQGSPAPPGSAAPQGGSALPFTPVCWALTGLCVLVFLANLATHEALNNALLLYGPAVAAGQWWRVFTADLAHGGPLHILFNLSVVWTLGRMLEQAIGSWRFLVTTVVGALGSAFMVLVVNFAQPTLGISGVVLAWAGAMLPLSTQAGRKQLGTWLVQVLIISLLPGVSWAGHLGGFAFGVPCGFVVRKGPRVFAGLALVLVFAAGALTYLAGSGRLAWGAP